MKPVPVQDIGTGNAGTRNKRTGGRDVRACGGGGCFVGFGFVLACQEHREHMDSTEAWIDEQQAQAVFLSGLCVGVCCSLE